MPIDSVSLMQLFKSTMGRDGIPNSAGSPAKWKSELQESYFVESSAAEILDLGQILGGQPNLLRALAQNYELKGETALSAAASEIEEFLSRNGEELDAQMTGIPRLTGLVYPVV